MWLCLRLRLSSTSVKLPCVCLCVCVRVCVRVCVCQGLGEMPQDAPSARGRRSLPGSGLVRTSSLTRDPLSGSRDCGQAVSKAAVHSLADRSEYVKQMKTLLNSKDFRERIKAIDQLVCDCEENPALVISSLFPVTRPVRALNKTST